MELGIDNVEFSKLLNIKGNVENVTPHKIAVVGFIREFGLLKLESKSMVKWEMAPKYRKDFCILALKLIQCPDMEYKDLENLIVNSEYNLLSAHLLNFCTCLHNIYMNGVNAIMDCVTSTIDKLMIERTETVPCMISRSSVLGFYLRRIMIHLEKFTFVQLVALYKSFCIYYQKGRPGSISRSLSKEKLNNMDPPGTQIATSPSATEESKHDLSLKMAILDKDHGLDEGQWSMKQAELFTARQATLLQINEKKALPPKLLQRRIAEIIKSIPEYSDIHFLSFLNCIRAKELSGAQDSLYSCFDRSLLAAANSTNSTADKNKNFRYAALNRAAMHSQFGHSSLAMEGIREAIVMGGLSGDAACLAAAAGWAAVQARGGGAARALLPRTPRAPRAAAAAALAAHLYAQHRAVHAAKPAHVFAIVTKGDAINYLHSMTDLTLGSLANTAALWSLYGHTEMASLYCQLLLNLNTKTPSLAGEERVYHWSGACGTAAAGLAAAAAWRGDALLAAALHARYPSPPGTQLALAARAAAALYAGKWEEAIQSIHQLASYNRWESQYLKAEMYFLKGIPLEALKALQDIFNYCKTEDDSLHFVSLRLRAMLLKSQIQQCFGNVHLMNNDNLISLNDALSIAKKYHLHYMAATTEMHIANLQLHLGCVKKSLKHVRKVLPVILAHGGAHDIGRALSLYVKCRVAAAPPSKATGEAKKARIRVLRSCCRVLDIVKKNLLKAGAQCRLLETWYLQAQLYNEIGNITARNHCACMYRQLEAQFPFESMNSLVMLY